MEMDKLISMNGTGIVKAAMADSKTTQVMLTAKLGYKGQGTISQRINTARMSLDKFAEMLAAMGYEVVVRKVKDNGSGDIGPVDMWKVEAPDFDLK